MNRRLRILCLVTALCLLMSGCSLDFRGYFQRLGAMSGMLPQEQTGFSQMTYTRPDMDNIHAVLQSSCDAAANASGLNQVINGIYAFYDVYDQFYTNYDLAYIHYCQDMTDIYWEGEYSFCMENASQVDAGLDQLFRALAAGPWRGKLEGRQYFGPGYFDAYDGESLWDETFLALMEEESRLLGEYYAVFEESLAAEPYSEEFFSSYGTRLEEIFVQLVAQRQQIAAYVGYESYPQFAYDFYYCRDYTPEQAVTYLSAVPDQLGALYRKVNRSNLWDAYNTACTEAETYAFGLSTAKAMGGSVREAFELMAEQGLYDISPGANKYDASFELYLYTYQSPFLFMNPSGDPNDKLVFVHEFGHFVNDYVCGGSGAGTDVAEVHSQTMEYLSLLYGEGGEKLEKLKMANTLSVYVDQSAYALFEHRVYGLREEELTAENVRALYESIGLEFGFDSWAWDSRDYVCIGHLFTDPMYLISYVTSNDLALQIYQKELDGQGNGLALYRECLESQESYLLTFAEVYGLENPLDPDRIPKVLKTLKDALE